MTSILLSSQNSLNHCYDHKAFSNDSRRPSKSLVVKPAGAYANLVLENVRILKRGESPSTFQNNDKGSNEDDDAERRFLDMIEAELDDMLKEIEASRELKNFAGSDCLVSPSPSSVPIPSFLQKKIQLY